MGYLKLTKRTTKHIVTPVKSSGRWSKPDQKRRALLWEMALNEIRNFLLSRVRETRTIESNRCWRIGEKELRELQHYWRTGTTRAPTDVSK